MSTLRRQKLNKLLRLRSTRLALSIKKTTPRWKGALIGLLLTLSLTISGCTQRYVPPAQPEEVTVDASLLSPSNYTSQLLEALSK